MNTQVSDILIDIITCPKQISIIGEKNNMSLISNKTYQKGDVVFYNKIQFFPLTKQIIIHYDNKHHLLENDIHFTITGNNKIYYGFDSFCNHSCDPNCHHIPTSDISYQMIASRYIQIGEEITCNYDVFKTEYNTAFECKCGSINCRKII